MSVPSREFRALANRVAELEHRLDELEMTVGPSTPDSMYCPSPVRYPFPEIVPGYGNDEEKQE